jgi:putative MATE family efflux protein
MSHPRTQDLSEQSIGRLLISYSAPAMFAMFVSAMYNVVDTIFIGHGAGTLALAGLAIAFPVQLFVLAVGMAIGIGSASVVSRALGAGDQRHAERTAGTSFFVSGALVVTIVALGLTFLEPVARLFGATDAVLPYTKEYLSIVLFGSIFFGVAVSSNVIVRAEGNVRVAMMSMVIGGVVNLILDPVFIFGFKMGLRGAAIATVIANISTFAYLAHYFLSGRSQLRIQRSDLMPYWAVMPEVFRIGASTFFQMVAGSLIVIPINRAIGIYGSDVHFAIVGVANRAVTFFFMPLFGLTQGLQPIVGFNYGAKRYDRVIEAIQRAALYATVLATTAFLTLMLATRPVLRLFSSDPELIEEGIPIIRMLVVLMPFVGLQMVGSSMFQALGKARPAFILNLARHVLLLPFVLLLPLAYGLPGVWFSFPVADSLAILITGFCVVTELRLLRSMVSNSPEREEAPAGSAPVVARAGTTEGSIEGGPAC